jgi:hypothetical protein
VALPAAGQGLARCLFDHLCPHALDVSDARLRNRSAPTAARRYERGHRGTRCFGHQLRRSDGNHPSRNGELRDRSSLCGIDFPASAGALRAQVWVEVAAPFGRRYWVF